MRDFLNKVRTSYRLLKLLFTSKKAIPVLVRVGDNLASLPGKCIGIGTNRLSLELNDEVIDFIEIELMGPIEGPGLNTKLTAKAEIQA